MMNILQFFEEKIQLRFKHNMLKNHKIKVDESIENGRVY